MYNRGGVIIKIFKYIKKNIALLMAAIIAFGGLALSRPVQAQAASYIYVNQYNHPEIKYPSSAHPKGTLKSSGCGVCSVWHILCNMTGKQVYSIENFTKLALKSGARIAEGTDIVKLVKAANDSQKEYSLSIVKTEDTNKLKAHLKKGQMAVLHQGGNSSYKIFSNGGHFVTAVGIDSKNQVRVLDSLIWKGKYAESPRKSRIIKSYSDGCLVSLNNVKKTTTKTSYYLVTVSYKKASEKPTIKSVVSNSSQITLTWNSISGAQNYYVQMADNKDFKNAVTINNSNKTCITINEFNKSALQQNKVYYFRVRARKYTGKISSYGSYSNTVSSRLKISVNAPKNLTLSTASNGNTSKDIIASWDKQSDISGYQIQLSQNSDFSNATTTNITNNSYTFNNLNYCLRYYVRIRCYKNVNNVNYYSSWTSQKSTGNGSHTWSNGKCIVCGIKSDIKSVELYDNDYSFLVGDKWPEQSKMKVTYTNGKVAIENFVTYCDELYTGSEGIFSTYFYCGNKQYGPVVYSVEQPKLELNYGKNLINDNQTLYFDDRGSIKIVGSTNSNSGITCKTTGNLIKVSKNGNTFTLSPTKYFTKTSENSEDCKVEFSIKSNGVVHTQVVNFDCAIKGLSNNNSIIYAQQGSNGTQNLSFTETYLDGFAKKFNRSVKLNSVNIGQQKYQFNYYGKSVIITYYVHCKTPTLKTTAKTKAIKLNWNKVSGATQYKLYRSTSQNGKYKCIKTFNSKTSSFTDSKLKSKTRYYYKIKAVGSYSKLNSYMGQASCKTK